jgi:hypothetical protein
LDEKALEFKRLQTPLHEELYETSMKSSEIPTSTRLVESFIRPLNPVIVKQQMHSSNKSSDNFNGRSIGINNQKNEMSVCSRNPNGTGTASPSVNCSPLLEKSLARLNE